MSDHFLLLALVQDRKTKMSQCQYHAAMTFHIRIVWSCKNSNVDQRSLKFGERWLEDVFSTGVLKSFRSTDLLLGDAYSAKNDHLSLSQPGYINDLLTTCGQ
jgi:hypothetical protein